MSNENEDKVNVGMYIAADELERMRRVARVDANGPAVLACARLGLEVAEKQKEA